MIWMQITASTAGRSWNDLCQGIGEFGGYDMVSLRAKYRKKAIEIMDNYPKGIHYSELLREVQRYFPDANWNTLEGSLWNLDETSKELVIKPERGKFLSKKFSLSMVDEAPQKHPQENIDINDTTEEAFYKPFADYLIENLSECIIADAYGNNRLGRKWMTPDVVGFYRVGTASPFQRSPEIVTAEIKTTVDYQWVIAGFGQASSYLLYSHKSYLVVPKQMEGEPRKMIESLCTLSGIGFVVFDKNNPEKPDFELRTKARRHEPDIFYLNKFGSKIVGFLEHDEYS